MRQWLYTAATLTELYQEPGHLRLTTQVQMEVGGQDIVCAKPFEMRLARAAPGDAVRTRGRDRPWLIEGVVEPVPTDSGAGRTKQRVLEKGGFGIAELL